MDDKRTQDDGLSEMIDAVRPASDDLAQADFARLAERSRRDARVRGVLQRSQRLDLAIGDALQDLPVPAGSVERLLSALESAASGRVAAQGAEVGGAEVGGAVSADTISGDAAVPITPANAVRAIETLVPDFKLIDAPAAFGQISSQDAASDDAASERASGEEQRSPTKRWRAGISGLAAAALAAAIAWVVFQPAPGEFGANEILNSDWLFTVDESAAHQTPLEQKQPPPRYPMATAIAIRPTAWRRITGFLGRSDGVAYQLRSAKARATLYVIDAEAGHDAPQVADLPPAPGSEPWTTAGKAMSVWRSGKLVYVLVVWGGDAEYKSFVTASGQLARIDASAARRAAAFSH